MRTQMETDSRILKSTPQDPTLMQLTPMVMVKTMAAIHTQMIQLMAK